MKRQIHLKHLHFNKRLCYCFTGLCFLLTVCRFALPLPLQNTFSLCICTRPLSHAHASKIKKNISLSWAMLLAYGGIVLSTSQPLHHHHHHHHHNRHHESPSFSYKRHHRYKWLASHVSNVDRLSMLLDDDNCICITLDSLHNTNVRLWHNGSSTAHVKNKKRKRTDSTKRIKRARAKTLWVICLNVCGTGKTGARTIDDYEPYGSTLEMLQLRVFKFFFVDCRAYQRARGSTVNIYGQTQNIAHRANPTK